MVGTGVRGGSAGIVWTGGGESMPEGSAAKLSPALMPGRSLLLSVFRIRAKKWEQFPLCLSRDDLMDLPWSQFHLHRDRNATWVRLDYLLKQGHFVQDRLNVSMDQCQVNFLHADLFQDDAVVFGLAVDEANVNH